LLYSFKICSTLDLRYTPSSVIEMLSLVEFNGIISIEKGCEEYETKIMTDFRAWTIAKAIRHYLSKNTRTTRKVIEEIKNASHLLACQHFLGCQYSMST
jgi:hypothetical protein